MAARSPSSPLPPPPARPSGRRGRGAEAHAVRSEASGLAGAAREVFADKSDLVWRGEEGSGGRRGPGRAGAAPAPVASAPPGSWRPEGLSVAEAKATRTQRLEEELSSLKEELALCQVSGLAAGLPVRRPGRGSAPATARSRPRAPREPSRDAPSRLHAPLQPSPGLQPRPLRRPGVPLDTCSLQRRLPHSEPELLVVTGT